MKARKKLTDFLPLYSDAKTGKIVIDEPPRDETPDMTTAEMDKLAGDERPVEVLPELKTGMVLIGKKGYRYRVRKVSKPRRDTGFAEPLFRLSKITEICIEGNMEFSQDELQAAGMKLEEV